MSELGFVVGGEGWCGEWVSVSLDFGMAGREVVRWYVDFFGLGGLGGGGGVNPYFLIEMNVEAYQHVCSHDINVQSNITTSRA